MLCLCVTPQLVAMSLQLCPQLVKLQTKDEEARVLRLGRISASAFIQRVKVVMVGLLKG